MNKAELELNLTEKAKEHKRKIKDLWLEIYSHKEKLAKEKTVQSKIGVWYTNKQAVKH